MSKIKLWEHLSKAFHGTLQTKRPARSYNQLQSVASYIVSQEQVHPINIKNYNKWLVPVDSKLYKPLKMYKSEIFQIEHDLSKIKGWQVVTSSPGHFLWRSEGEREKPSERDWASWQLAISKVWPKSWTRTYCSMRLGDLNWIFESLRHHA